MRKLIVEEWITLDGFAADKNGGLDFFTNLSPEQNTYSDQMQLKFLESVDAIILGRKTYQLFVEFWPEATVDKEPIADALNAIPKYIVSSTLEETHWGKWPAPTIIRPDAMEYIRQMKTLPGKNIVVWGSLSLVQDIIAAGLTDEFRIQLCPLLLCEGRSLFSPDKAAMPLHLVEQRAYETGVVFLNYHYGG
jgi:dihydrofolate reductase